MPKYIDTLCERMALPGYTENNKYNRRTLAYSSHRVLGGISISNSVIITFINARPRSMLICRIHMRNNYFIYSVDPINIKPFSDALYIVYNY